MGQGWGGDKGRAVLMGRVCLSCPTTSHNKGARVINLLVVSCTISLWITRRNKALGRKRMSQTNHSCLGHTHVVGAWGGQW